MTTLGARGFYSLGATVIERRSREGKSRSSEKKPLAPTDNKVNKVNFGPCTTAHFTVVCSVTWPLNGSKAEGDLALIETSLLLSCRCT